MDPFPLSQGSSESSAVPSPLLCSPGSAPGSFRNIHGRIGPPFIWFLGMHVIFVDTAVHDTVRACQFPSVVSDSLRPQGL